MALRPDRYTGSRRPDLPPGHTTESQSAARYEDLPVAGSWAGDTPINTAIPSGHSIRSFYDGHLKPPELKQSGLHKNPDGRCPDLVRAGRLSAPPCSAPRAGLLNVDVVWLRGAAGGRQTHLRTGRERVCREPCAPNSRGRRSRAVVQVGSRNP
jgi:hypothetical protein